MAVKAGTLRNSIMEALISAGQYGLVQISADLVRDQYGLVQISADLVRGQSGLVQISAGSIWISAD